MQITLLIPDLILPQPPGGLIDVYRDVNLPDLEFLLGKSDRDLAPAASLETWLCEAFGVTAQSDLPIAALCLLADHGDPGSAFWLRVDPVHLQPQRDELVLLGAEQLSITRLEADQLIEALNGHFGSTGISFHTLHPQRWYARTTAALEIVTHTLPEVLGKSIGDRLASGYHGNKVRKLMNEAQMLLHTHPVNQAREAQGQPTVNSIWPWGGGCLPTLHGKPFRYIWSNDPLAQGLAIASRTSCRELPASGEGLWAQGRKADHQLVVLDGLRNPASYGDYAAWQRNLKSMEDKWFRPLAKAFRNGRIKSLRLHALGRDSNLVFTLEGGARWRFWRRAKPVRHFAALP
jgi:hypothetical protein